MEITVSAARRSVGLVIWILVMTCCPCTCRIIEVSLEKDGSSSNAEQQSTNIFEGTNGDGMSDFMERSGVLFFSQKPTEGKTAASQNMNQMHLQPYFPKGGSQIYPEYTAQDSTAAGVVQQSAIAPVSSYDNARHRASLQPQGNVPAVNAQNAHQGSAGAVHRTGNYGGYAQDGGYARTEQYGYGYNPGFQKEIKVGVPASSVGLGINLDPFRFIRALLRAIPRPLLNLNGKVFFGVELGNKVGLATKPQQTVQFSSGYY